MKIHDSQIVDLIKLAKAALKYIDSIPKDVELPAMPGFDRDWTDDVIYSAEKCYRAK